MPCSPEGHVEIQIRECLNGEYVTAWVHIDELELGGDGLRSTNVKASKLHDDPFVKIGYGIGLALNGKCKCPSPEPTPVTGK